MTGTANFNSNTCLRFYLLIFLITTLTGCIYQPSSAVQPEDGFLVKQSSIIFFVSTPFNTEADSEIYLDIVDEITGINFNPVRHKMQFVSENLFSLELSFPEYSLVKYRYAIGSNPTTIEHNTSGEPVRYRVVNTRSTETVVARDVIATWTDSPVNISLGRLEGKLIDAKTGAGIPNALVNLNGLQTASAVDGSFFIENAMPGKFIITVFNIDGRYETFQQEAIIASDSSTPAEIALSSRPISHITFIVTPPPDHNLLAPIRLIGGASQLGNGFSDQTNGTGFAAADNPTLRAQSDGTYTLTLELPAGMDMRYKYSLGDGFWNAERHADGQFITRQLIVPAEDSTITETIANWKTGQRLPIRIEVLPQNDIALPQQLYIQFHSFIWTAPIPMWQNIEKDIWLYEVFSPLYLSPVIDYRLCYDAQCADLVALANSNNPDQLSFPTDGSQSLIQHEILQIPESDSKSIHPSPTDHFYSPVGLHLMERN